MWGLCSTLKPNLFDLFRCEGDISRSDRDCAETRNQSGHSILCDERTAELVQRWESLHAGKQEPMSLSFLDQSKSISLSLSNWLMHLPLYFLPFSINPTIGFGLKGDDPRREMHPIVTAMFGATAGAASVFGNTPLDVVKTRMQVGNPPLWWFPYCHQVCLF